MLHALRPQKNLITLKLEKKCKSLCRLAADLYIKIFAATQQILLTREVRFKRIIVAESTNVYIVYIYIHFLY